MTSDLRAAYAGFHPDARALLDVCDDVLISALYVRDPLPAWSAGQITLMGDACHPMMPFMAQGVGMAIEDGVVLARCLADAGADDIPAALARYQAARHERTSRIPFPLNRGREIFVFATVAQESWRNESWTTPGRVEDGRAMTGNGLSSAARFRRRNRTPSLRYRRP
ncbi:hypothetical protein EPAKOI_005202 (plasmid) [Cupriavidus sp. H18C2]